MSVKWQVLLSYAPCWWLRSNRNSLVQLKLTLKKKKKKTLFFELFKICHGWLCGGSHGTPIGHFAAIPVWNTWWRKMYTFNCTWADELLCVPYFFRFSVCVLFLSVGYFISRCLTEHEALKYFQSNDQDQPGQWTTLSDLTWCLIVSLAVMSCLFCACWIMLPDPVALNQTNYRLGMRGG